MLHDDNIKIFNNIWNIDYIVICVTMCACVCMCMCACVFMFSHLKTFLLFGMTSDIYNTVQANNIIIFKFASMQCLRQFPLISASASILFHPQRLTFGSVLHRKENDMIYEAHKDEWNDTYLRKDVSLPFKQNQQVT